MWAEAHGESRGPKGGEEESGGPARVEGGGRAHGGAGMLGSDPKAPAKGEGSAQALEVVHVCRMGLSLRMEWEPGAQWDCSRHSVVLGFIRSRLITLYWMVR